MKYSLSYHTGEEDESQNCMRRSTLSMEVLARRPPIESKLLSVSGEAQVDLLDLHSGHYPCSSALSLHPASSRHGAQVSRRRAALCASTSQHHGRLVPHSANIYGEARRTVRARVVHRGAQLALQWQRGRVFDRDIAAALHKLVVDAGVATVRASGIERM